MHLDASYILYSLLRVHCSKQFNRHLLKTRRVSLLPRLLQQCGTPSHHMDVARICIELQSNNLRLVKILRRFVDMNPTVVNRSTDKGKYLLHYILAQTVRATTARLVSRQVVILLLTFLGAIRSIISAQCSCSCLGHNPDIKQRLFALKLVDAPQRDTTSLSKSAVSKSYELVIHHPLSEHSHRVEVKRHLEMNRDGGQQYGLLQVLIVGSDLILAVLLNVQQFVLRQSSLQNKYLQLSIVDNAFGNQCLLGSRTGTEFGYLPGGRRWRHRSGCRLLHRR